MWRFFDTALVGVAAATAMCTFMSLVDGQTITAETKVPMVGFMNFGKADQQGEMLVSALETDVLLHGERGRVESYPFCYIEVLQVVQLNSRSIANECHQLETATAADIIACHTFQIARCRRYMIMLQYSTTWTRVKPWRSFHIFCFYGTLLSRTVFPTSYFVSSGCG